MRLRVKSAKGLINVNLSIEPLTFGDLVDHLQKELATPNTLSFKVGFPPKAICYERNQALSDLGIKDGDSIIVEHQPLQGQGGLATTAMTPPPSTSSPANHSIPSPPSQQLKKTHAAVAVARKMKDDNSCLFRSIAYIFLQDAELHSSLREIVKEAILNDQFRFNEGILGRPTDEYAKWIMKPESWGGAIELSILSEFFGTCIVSVDISTGRFDQFGEDNYSNSAFVIYSGIHYDVLALSKGPTRAEDVLVFELQEKAKMEGEVKILALQLKKERKFTDLASFTLKCEICLVGIKGQKEAQDHAMKSGHSKFSEY